MKLLIGIVLALASFVTMMDAQAPTNLQAQSPASLQPRVVLNWSAPTGTSFFKVYRSSPDTTNFQWIAISQVRQFEDQAVTPGMQYHYVVTAVVSKDSILLESARSNIASVRAYALPAGPKGIIAGTITDQITGSPIAKAIVRFFKMPSPANRGLDISTTSAGTFSAVVDTGVYLVRAEESLTTTPQAGHLAQWYLHAGGPGDATPVAVMVNETTHVNFSLPPNSPQPYAYVSGFVTDALGTPISGAVVAFVRPIQELVTSAATTAQTPGIGAEAVVIPGIGYSRGVAWFGYTNTSGKFFAQVLSGRQYVALSAKIGYYPEFYDNASDPAQATVLAVRGDTTGINFSLRKKAPTDTGTMQGVVTDPDGNTVPARIILFPRPKEGTDRPATFTYTDSSGIFLFNDIEAGSYSVLAIPFGNYAPSFSTTSGATALTWLNADSVVVNGTTPHVNISVPPLQSAGLIRISGRVLTANSAPLPGVRILARTADGKITGYGLSDFTGRYAVEALGGGPVTLLADRFQFNFVQAPLTVPLNTFSVDNVDLILSASYPTAVDDQSTTPLQMTLFQNYPNPFNPATTIGFTVAGASTGSGSTSIDNSPLTIDNRLGSGVWGLGSSLVTLVVYDLLGREVATLVNERMSAGNYVVTFDGSKLASGMYLYRLMSDGVVTTRKMMLVK
jgi:hypothetical protein